MLKEVRALAASIVVHAIGLWLVLPGNSGPRVAFAPPAHVADRTIDEPPTEVELVAEPTPVARAGTTTTCSSRRSPSTRTATSSQCA